MAWTMTPHDGAGADEPDGAAAGDDEEVSVGAPTLKDLIGRYDICRVERSLANGTVEEMDGRIPYYDLPYCRMPLSIFIFEAYLPIS